jgi:hypothetical protein
MDGFSKYNQMKMSEEDKEETTFVTHGEPFAIK